MDGLNYCVKHGHGKFNVLDKAYDKFIKNSLRNSDENDIERWEIYNVLMVELINLGKMDYFEEAKYRLTGGEDPNEVMLDMINKDFDTTLVLGNYEENINYFIDKEIMDRLCKEY